MTPLTADYFRRNGFEELTPSWLAFRGRRGDIGMHVYQMRPTTPWRWAITKTEGNLRVEAMGETQPQTEEEADEFLNSIPKVSPRGEVN